MVCISIKIFKLFLKTFFGITNDFYQRYLRGLIKMGPPVYIDIPIMFSEDSVMTFLQVRRIFYDDLVEHSMNLSRIQKTVPFLHAINILRTFFLLCTHLLRIFQSFWKIFIEHSQNEIVLSGYLRVQHTFVRTNIFSQNICIFLHYSLVTANLAAKSLSQYAWVYKYYNSLQNLNI